LTLAQTRLNSQALAGAKAALTAIPQEYTGDKTWIVELNNLNQALSISGGRLRLFLKKMPCLDVFLQTRLGI